MTNDSSQQRRLLLLELNELNFDMVRAYIAQGKLKLKNFERLLALESRETVSEDTYESLEPWIQWVSAHSGLNAREHGIFRLGDAVGSGVPQILEQLEAAGLRVGGISPMNMENRLLQPAYFVPDPWTRTPTDDSRWSAKIWKAISQAVNDNASGRLSALTVLWLVLAFGRFARPRHYLLYLWLLARAKRSPWRKALFLDLFLHDVHAMHLCKSRPNISILFLNAAAHIQHHYLFNARALTGQTLRNPDWYVAVHDDPVAETLKLYDVIVGEYLDKAPDMIVATGLTQVPYDRVKFYYRLKDHEIFLRHVGVEFRSIAPRMTRDFLVEFDSESAADRGYALLSTICAVDDKTPIFREIERRGHTLFVTLTYPHEIKPAFMVAGENIQPFDLASHVVFVAIKNGMHSGKGFAFFTGDVAKYAPPNGAHVKSLHRTVLAYFSL